MKPLLALGAMLALAACDTVNSAPPADSFPLLDPTGRVVAYAPGSAVRNTPPGTAMRLNINGTDQLVTLGSRTSEPVSAGTPVIIGIDNGRPIIGHEGPGQGNLAPAGTPVITGTRENGSPIITYVQPGQQAPQGTVAGRRGSRNVAPTAPGTLAPGVAPVVTPAR